MQSDFSPPLTRMDVVLWFLRAQLWVLVLGAGASLPSSVSYFSVGYAKPAYLNFASFGLPILILAMFPQVLAAAMLGGKTREPVATLADLRSLVGRCAGVALFVGSIGRVVASTLNMAQLYFSSVTFVQGGPLGSLDIWNTMGIGAAFFLGFALAFGPVIRENFRAS